MQTSLPCTYTPGQAATSHTDGARDPVESQTTFTSKHALTLGLYAMCTNGCQMEDTLKVTQPSQ